MLSHKKQKAYEGVFRYVHENIIPLRCNYFMTNFETAIRNAFVSVVPDSKPKSCSFHFAQSCKRRVAQKHGSLVQLCRMDDKARLIYYKLLSLPLLNTIEEAFCQAQIPIEDVQHSRNVRPRDMKESIIHNSS